MQGKIAGATLTSSGFYTLGLQFSKGFSKSYKSCLQQGISRSWTLFLFSPRKHHKVFGFICLAEAQNYNIQICQTNKWFPWKQTKIPMTILSVPCSASTRELPYELDQTLTANGIKFSLQSKIRETN